LESGREKGGAAPGHSGGPPSIPHNPRPGPGGSRGGGGSSHNGGGGGSGGHKR
jgi:hypothetical protein